MAKMTKVWKDTFHNINKLTDECLTVDSPQDAVDLLAEIASITKMLAKASKHLKGCFEDCGIYSTESHTIKVWMKKSSVDDRQAIHTLLEQAGLPVPKKEQEAKMVEVVR